MPQTDKEKIMSEDKPTHAKDSSHSDHPHHHSAFDILQRIEIIGVVRGGWFSLPAEPDAIAEPPPEAVVMPRDRPATLQELKSDWNTLNPGLLEAESPFISPNFYPILPTLAPLNVRVQASERPVNVDELIKALQAKGVQIDEDDKGITFSTLLKELPGYITAIAALITAYATLKKKSETTGERVTVQVIFNDPDRRSPKF